MSRVITFLVLTQPDGFQLNVKFTTSKLSPILLLVRSRYRPDWDKSKFDDLLQRCCSTASLCRSINRMLQTLSCPNSMV